jgi:hypothetical protein
MRKRIGREKRRCRRSPRGDRELYVDIAIRINMDIKINMPWDWRPAPSRRRAPIEELRPGGGIPVKG